MAKSVLPTAAVLGWTFKREITACTNGVACIITGERATGFDVQVEAEIARRGPVGLVKHPEDTNS